MPSDNPTPLPLPPLPTAETTPAPPPPPAAIEQAAMQLAEVPQDAMKAAVDTSHAAAAPTTATEQDLSRHESLLDTLLNRAHEFAAFMERAGPLLALVEQAAASTSPAAMANVGAVVSRVEALEGFAADLVASLGNHFSGKLNLPNPPAA